MATAFPGAEGVSEPLPPRMPRLPAPPGDGSPRSLFSRTVHWARDHPVLAITLFSPVIPELLSGDTPLALLYVAPADFVGLLLLEMGLYGSGVLLVREAIVRWNKGWGSALLLAVAFGLLEEGFTTILFPHAFPLANPPLFGRWEGINWIWAALILQLHASYSIGSQLLLFHLAFPEHRRRSLLNDAGVVRSFVLLFGCYAAFLLLSPGWVPPFPQLLLPLGAILVLVPAGRWLPADRLAFASRLPRWSPRQSFLLGFLFAPSVVLFEGLDIGFHLPAVLGVCAMGLTGAVFLGLWLYGIGREHNEPQLVAWLAGMLALDALYGAVVDPFGIPLEIVVAAPLAYALLRIWRRSLRGTAGSPTPPARTAISALPTHGRP